MSKKNVLVETMLVGTTLVRDPLFHFLVSRVQDLMLFFYNYEYPQKGPLLIVLSRLVRDS